MNLELLKDCFRRTFDRKSRSNLGFWLVLGGLFLPLGYASAPPASAQTLERAPLEVIRSAAERGDARSQYELGRAYEDGFGLKRDVNEAVKWYEKAAGQGLNVAQYVLGNILLYGEGGVAPDYAQARKWLTTAARTGIPAAQRDLGKMHEQGLGGERDPIWAWVWYDFAAAGGDTKANQLRDVLSRRLDSEQLAEANRLANDLAPQVAPPHGRDQTP